MASACLRPALEVGPDLPSAEAIDRWLGEPLRAAILPTSIFLTNKKGFPVLSRPHQRLLGRLLKVWGTGIGVVGLSDGWQEKCGARKGTGRLPVG